VVNEILNIKSCDLDVVNLPQILAREVRVEVLRLDKIHEVVSGNKWFKLKYYVDDAIKQKKSILTLGGPYSNHLLATAWIANGLGIHSVGLVRGEKPSYMSHTLQLAGNLNMELVYLTRNEYRKRDSSDFIAELVQSYPHCIIIPEGGNGNLGVRGSEEILSTIDTEKYTHIACAMGTGTTLIGLTNASRKDQCILGFPVLKIAKDQFLRKCRILSSEEKSKCISIFDTYHFGGYAKKTPGLLKFMNNFFARTGIPTDFVYTGKLFYGVLDLIAAGYFPPGSILLIVHSGGLQGNLSLEAGSLDFT